MKTIKSKDDLIIGLRNTVKMRTRYQRGDRQWVHHVNIDYTGTTIGDLLNWSSAERIIKFQNQIRSLENRSAFNAFMELGDEIDIFAFDAHKPVTDHTTKEQIIEIL